MTDICLCFEVHQPYRLRKSFCPLTLGYGSKPTQELFNSYFDTQLTQFIFNRVADACYHPACQVLLRLIEEGKDSGKPLKASFGLSGPFLEQCESYRPNLLEEFRKLGKTGCVEFLDEPYYHSLASLYPPEGGEFLEQVKMHKRLVRELLGCETKVFENTELIYNNAIAKTVEGLGYTGIFTEATERLLGPGGNPNHVYTAKGCRELRVLLRNHRLTDDVAFRFSSRSWDQWPLTAEKYAAWLAATQGQCITIFMDYETFGEHHKRETGIFEFLDWLPKEVGQYDHLAFKTPSEVIASHQPIGEIDVPEAETVSWADLERDLSAWLGNPMQWTSYEELRNLEPLVERVGDEGSLRIWRHLQSSDHLYYMSAKGGEPGMVHSYFSPYANPFEAYAMFVRLLIHFGLYLFNRSSKKTSQRRTKRNMELKAPEHHKGY